MLKGRCDVIGLETLLTLSRLHRFPNLGRLELPTLPSIGLQQQETKLLSMNLQMSL